MLRSLLLIVLASTPAVGAQAQQVRVGTADDIERGRIHFEAGALHYEEERYEAAIREFEIAYELVHHPDVLYNLGQSYDQLGDRRQALEHYRRYLLEAGEVADRERIERRVGELEELLADDVATPPDEPEDEAAADTGGGVDPGAIVSFSVGGALAIGAIVTAVVAAGQESELADACTFEGRDGSFVCPARGSFQDTIDTRDAMALASTFLTVGAALGVALGVALLFVGGDDEPTATVEVVPAPGGAGARVRF